MDQSGAGRVDAGRVDAGRGGAEPQQGTVYTPAPAPRKTLLDMLQQEGPFNIVPTPDGSPADGSPEGTEGSERPSPEEGGGGRRGAAGMRSSEFVGAGAVSSEPSAPEPSRLNFAVGETAVDETAGMSSEELVQVVLARHREQQRKQAVEDLLSSAEPGAMGPLNGSVDDPRQARRPHIGRSERDTIVGRLLSERRGGSLLLQGNGDEEILASGSAPVEYNVFGEPVWDPTRTKRRAVRVKVGRGQPRPVSVSRVDGPPPKEDEIITVSNQRVKNRNSKARVKTEISAQRRKEETFRPKINRSYTGSRGDSAPERPKRFRDRVRTLHEQHAERVQRWAERRKRETEEQMKKSCTFKPKINKLGDTPSRAGQAVEERLMQAADGRVAMRAKIKARIEDDEVRKCTFTPSIGMRSRRAAAKTRAPGPIYRRLGALDKRKQDKLEQQRREQVIQNKDLTFTPQIGPNSRAIVDGLRKDSYTGAIPVEDRLMNNLGSRVAHKMRRQAEVERQMKAEYTFEPKLSDASRQIAEAKFHGTGASSFAERQSVLEDIRVARIRDKQRRTFREKGYTFKPDIGNSDLILRQSRGAGSLGLLRGETQEETYERLAFQDSYARERNREQLEREVYGGLDFKPDINATSRQIADGLQRGGLENLVTGGERRRAAMQEAKKAADDKFRRECTFKPKLLSRSAKSKIAWRVPKDRTDLTKPQTLLKDIKKKQSARERRMDKIKSERDYNEMKECTFVPKTVDRKRVKQPTGPVLVRGMARFMELKQLKKQMDEEQRLREEKVFHMRPGKSRSKPYTTPKPFNLSTNTVQKRKQEQLESRLDRARGAMCTFRPKTLARTNRKLIRQILEQPSAALTAPNL